MKTRLDADGYVRLLSKVKVKENIRSNKPERDTILRQAGKKLSARQQRILEFLGRFLDEKGYPPTVRDIVRGCQISSTSVVDYNLRILEREDYIRRDREVSRGIGLRDQERERERSWRVPLLGYIAAGEPLPVPHPDDWASMHPIDTLELTPEMAGGRREVYALRVKGQSMVDALVNDGDIVLMELPSQVEDGDMVAVWLRSRNETTLKKIYREPDRVRLQPANSQMKPIYVNLNDVEVQGKVIGVIRRMS